MEVLSSASQSPDDAKGNQGEVNPNCEISEEEVEEDEPRKDSKKKKEESKNKKNKKQCERDNTEISQIGRETGREGVL